ncbi:MAG: glutamine-hydrolyzing GMP synthase, partial [Legionellaceae bacterium]|nr:glutamine-hydrolyzing GMP synthase [Legionellaceae bacterium]
GGVDSSVVAALLHRAIGHQCTPMFVDTGLLRENETHEVVEAFKNLNDFQLVTLSAQKEFLGALKGVTCPEEKRKAIGRVFIEVLEAASKDYPDMRWLAQGTIYPDVIESAAASTEASVIKSHHNVGGLPETMELLLLEPLRYLFKDEVRELGLALGLPKTCVYRHPFPGPGLAVRILGEITAENIAILQKADAIFLKILRKHDWYDKVSQAFAVFLPIKTVGVAGDGRRYAYVIALRAVQTDDFMTARWANLPAELLSEAASQIMNHIPEVARVVYDISDKPPSTIEWE